MSRSPVCVQALVRPHSVTGSFPWPLKMVTRPFFRDINELPCVILEGLLKGEYEREQTLRLCVFGFFLIIALRCPIGNDC